MTPLSKAAEAVALVESKGHSIASAARITGLNDATVWNILRGEVGWEERKNTSVFKSYWQAEKARLQHAMTELTKDSLAQAYKVMDKASYLQAVTGAGILIDKTRLLAGEPTEIHASVNTHAILGLDKLAALLSRSLIESNTVPVDQTAQTPDK